MDEEVADELVVDEEVPDGGWLSPEEPGVVRVHDLTSWTAGLPSASVIGVRVILHVRIIGPIIV